MNFETLHNPNTGSFAAFIADNMRWPFPVVREKYARGRTLLICGAGPSLRDGVEYIQRGVDDVWGCNSALNWLTDNEHRVTHGVTVDQSERMFDMWAKAPDVIYYLASSVHPGLVSTLVKQRRTKIAFFHSFTSVEGEGDLYMKWCSVRGPTICVGDGLNTVNRAVDVAGYLGYRKIYVAGADCAFGADGSFHADESHETPGKVVHTASPEFLDMIGADRPWDTSADMLMSAIDLVKKQRLIGDKLEFVGDTLPNAMRDLNDEILDRCMRWATREEVDANCSHPKVSDNGRRPESASLTTGDAIDGH